ncbi:hypothetical protein [Actinomyces naeslundii]|uniref:Uncharacterized protein n=1 Tax=Actinomyces naeslundii (strain ATCC 12104 / DSM 43013 / CCUG 2238 / JCM 8349 / NCTC 10301 / Howell 279) TaxID=1115803 RepID=J3ADQ5_ACTNH|nr:hypothetical protein [Actinomyces naeslundii]EJN86163.1 hypothetical protein HMPREF1129_1269 [Actinomyces naeslundii str. Howell 279]
MEAYEIDHLAAVRALAPECMVLLRSDGAFPRSSLLVWCSCG